MMRGTEERKRDVLAVLERHGQMWLTTASAGRPHAIGVSALWDGSVLLVTTAGTSRTAQNIRESRVATLLAGNPDDAVVIHADLVESMPAAGAEEVARRWVEVMGWDPRETGEGWHFFRLRPNRVQAFRGYDEIEGREVMRGGRWLA